jgi:hypothetical protein
MESSFFRPRLYRKVAVAVILGLCGLAGLAQFAKKAPKTSGPRALAVLQLAANGKAHLVPVTIMIDGKFYDAGAYKADPVPMALQSETVYEALKTGDPQGLFTVSGALHNDKNGWIGDGKWRSTAQIEAEKAKRKAAQEKLEQKAPEVEKGPPKLKRGKPSADEPPVSSAPPPKAEKPTSEAKSAPPPVEKLPDSNSDPDRPVLRRQPVGEEPHEQTKAGSESEPLKGPIDLVPAISDADGPDPRPYSYQMKPDEEQARLKKVQAIATEELKARISKAAGSDAPAKKPDKTTRPTREVPLQDVRMRVFDLSNSNEPVLVLTANSKSGELTYTTTVIAREDIYGDLHKVFAQTTDNQHLDALPRYELIDAVDADGDGRGELLFRMNWDSGAAFGVYRVIGDRLWPLFEGKPGS